MPEYVQVVHPAAVRVLADDIADFAVTEICHDADFEPSVAQRASMRATLRSALDSALRNLRVPSEEAKTHG